MLFKYEHKMRIYDVLHFKRYQIWNTDGAAKDDSKQISLHI